MADYLATIEWTLDGDFAANRYSRAHRWRFDGGAELAASASPHIVAPPLADPAGVDPEEALVASASSCHMLWFLALARKKGFEVASYEDDADGILDGKRFTSATLRPRVRWEGEPPPPEAIEGFHHRAHELCFIAASVDFPVEVAPQ